MKKIVVFDTWSSNQNLGNRIIMDAVAGGLRELFPRSLVYHLPAVEAPRALGSRRILEGADHVFYAGTNMLRADMNHRWNEWGLQRRDVHVRDVVLFGVGWWQYQSEPVNLYTRRLLEGALHHGVAHSVRDSYTAKRLQELGFDAINTGCPTIWSVNPAHCRAIPDRKADAVVLTLTAWKRDIEADRALFEIVARNYQTIKFWPQQFDDYDYAREVCGAQFERLQIISPALEAYDEVLQSEEIDFIGNRLHGGIRALQHQRRAIVVTVDNRATEMGRDFNLPICLKAEVETKLEALINSQWQSSVTPDHAAIETWKRQFVE